MRRKQVLTMAGVSLLTIITAVLVGYGIAVVISGIGRPSQVLLDTPQASASVVADRAAGRSAATATAEHDQAVLSASGSQDETAEASPPSATGEPLSAAAPPPTATASPPPATSTPAPASPTATGTALPPTASPSPTTPPPTITARPSATAAPPSPTAMAAPPVPTQTALGSPAPPETVFISDTFSAATSGWPIQETDTWSANYVDGRYQLTIQGVPRIGISYPLAIEDYRLSADVAVESGGAGFVFLFGPGNAFYWFGISADGAYTIQRLQDEQATTIVDWTASELLPTTPGQPVTLRLERRGRRVQFYASDRPLAELTIPAGAWSNRYGFLIASSRQQARASFDNLLGVRLDE